MNAQSSPALLLRAVEPSDADFMYEVENDSAAWRYSDTIAPLSRTILRDYALAYEANPFSSGQLRLIVCEKKTGNPVGILDFYDISPVHRRAFIGIYITPDYRRKGYASNVLRLAADYAHRHLRLRLLAARIESTNHPSMALFGEAGFRLKAEIPEWFADSGGSLSSLCIFTLPLAGASIS